MLCGQYGDTVISAKDIRTKKAKVGIPAVIEASHIVSRLNYGPLHFIPIA